MCFGSTPRKRLTEAKITRVLGGPCVHKTFIYQLVGYPPFDWIQEQSTYQACWRNEIVALQERHLLNEGDPEKEEWERCNTHGQALAKLLGPVRVATPAEVVAHKGSPATRKRYEDAFASYDRVGPGATWDRVSAFVKVEKWTAEQTSILRKPPRMIQFRSYKYCGKLSQIILPIEEKLWTVQVDGMPVFAKNMNSFVVAATLRRMADDFVDPLFIMIDYSKMDSCITQPWIVNEQRFYGAVAGNSFGATDELDQLIEAQMVNKCYTKGGVRYIQLGRKMSGEYTTSSGDNVINFEILCDVFRFVRHRKLMNGDDGVIMIEKDDLVKLDLSESRWRRYGFKAKVDFTDVFEEIDFCQCRPIEIRDGVWRMVREPKRAVSRSCVSAKRYEGRAWYGLMAAMGYSELACGDGVPMMQAWAQYLMRASCGAPPLPSELSRRAKLERAVSEAKGVTDTARESFFRAFGFSVEEQLDFESWCNSRVGKVLPACYPDDRVVV